MATHRKSITGVDLSFYPHLRQHGAGERERVFGFPDLWPFFFKKIFILLAISRENLLVNLATV